MVEAESLVTAVIAVGSAPPLVDAHRKATDPPPIHPPIEVFANQRIGRFGVIRELARGGMGQVFLARDTKLGRKVAIKFLLQHDPSVVQRFVIEARATARCTHENIVTIYEVGEHQGLPFMVLEYLEGKPLSDLLIKPMPVRELVEILAPVVRALDRAHEHGIVHRDLKPSNIFVTDRGTVKVLDFGVAKCFEAPPEVRAATAPDGREPARDGAFADEISYITFSNGGMLVGTLPYMSPEQWGAGEVDHLSDLWAIGVLFWRVLTGVHPAGTGEPAKLRERLVDLDTPLASLATRSTPAYPIPPEIVAIADRCLAKRKADRYPSAAALLADLVAFLQPRAPLPSSSGPLATELCPYRGLAAFTETDADVFFGRSGEIRTALGRLEDRPLLAVVGPSGVGKSSFVSAGLVPAMRATGKAWHVRHLRPGRAPLQGLAGMLLEEEIPPAEADAIIAELGEAPGQLGEALRRNAVRRGHRVLIVVDQLEELFTLSDDARTREVFLAALLAAADDRSAPVRVVLSMRADFLDRLAGARHFLAELSRGLFFLAAPDRDNLRETLVRPAEYAGYAFEDPAIVEELLGAANHRGALPLLQFAATRLWDARDRDRKLLTRASYEAMGGAGGAFVRHADEIAAAVPPERSGVLRAIMTRLVTPEGTRAVVDRDELRSLGDAAEIEGILDQLVAGRLIHVHADPHGDTTVEIVHEVLITAWPTLARWLDETHALRGFTNDLRVTVRQWVARGKPSELVWRGPTAAEALALTQRHALDLSEHEREFLAAVRAHAARRRRLRVAAVVAIFAALALVIAGGAIAVVEIRDAELVAREQAEAAESEARRARAAEIAKDQQLAALREEQRRREDAEAEAQRQLAAMRHEAQRRAQAEAERRSAEEVAHKATRAARRSHDELELANIQLEGALEGALRNFASMKRSVDDAQTLVNKLQAQLSDERARLHRLRRAAATAGVELPE